MAAQEGQILTSDILKDDNLDTLIPKIKALETVIQSLTDSIHKNQVQAAQLEAATTKLSTATVAGREAIVKNAKAADDLERAHKSYQKALSEETVKVQELKLATATITNLKKNEAKAALAAEGSYNKLSAQYSIMKLALNAMSKAERETTDEGRKLVKMANDTYQEMKRLQAETGKTALNVGNYGEAVQGVEKNVGELRKELIALRNVSFAGKSEEEIKALNQQIGNLVDEMEDLRAIQKAQGTEMSTLYVGSLKVVAAGVEGLVGTLSLLGVESETVQNLEKKMLQLVAVTHALSEIEDALQKRTIQTTIARTQAALITAKDTVVKWANNVATVAAARAEDAKTVAMARGSITTRAAAAVQWLWNAALAANPIGLVVVAVAALAAGLVYLTSRMGESAALAKSLSAELTSLQAAAESNEEFRQFQLKLADEYGKTEIEKTQLNKRLTNERIKDIEAELSTLSKLTAIKGLDDEQAQRRTELNKELLRLGDERILLGIRETTQQKEAAEAAAKEAAERAKAAKAERERLAREEKARLQEKQDAFLAELEAQKQLDLARLDAEKDYGNTSQTYQQQFATIRLATEQAAQTTILGKQREFGRITETEYQAQLKRLEANAKEFVSTIQSIVDPLGNSLRKNIEAAFSGEGGDLSPLQNIFDANAERDIKARALKIAASAGEGLSEGVVKSRDILGRLFDGESLLDILGLDSDAQAGVKSSLDFAKQQLTDYLAFRTQIANRNVANADREVQAAQAALDNQIQLQAAGLANTVASRQQDLADAQARREEALKAQERAAKQEQLIAGSQQAVNMALALSKLFATNPLLAIGLGALVIGSFVGFKIAAANASKKQYGHGDFQVLEGGSHASGDDIPLGTSRNGQQEYAEGGEGRMIIPKDATSKYRTLLPEIFQALKQKDFENQFQRIGKASAGIPLIVNVGGGTTINTGGIERRLDMIHKQGQEKTIVDGKGRMITTYKNLTQIHS